VTITLVAGGCLICFTLLQRQGSTGLIGLPGSGLLALLVALVVMVSYIWTDSSESDLEDTAWSTASVAFGLSVINLLFLATVDRAYEWVRIGATVLVGAMVAQFVRITWMTNSGDGSLRLFFALFILSAAACAVVAVLDRFVRPASASDAPGYCPRCGAVIQEAVSGRNRCADCGASFRVELFADRA
jgi:hypothetical protein